jgi:regulatory protein
VAAEQPDATAGQDAVRAALAFVLRSTQQRPQTEAEVAVQLRRRGVDDDAAAAALDRAKALGAVDDAAFARAWVDDRATKRGYGVARVRAELRRRLVPDAIVDAVLARLEDRDELAVATELAKARAAQLPAPLAPEAVARRVMSFLIRRGYPPPLAQRAAITASGLDRHWD